jgi:hypothetical protein
MQLAGKIIKDGVVVGRIQMGDDGAAVVYVGAAGTEALKDDGGAVRHVEILTGSSPANQDAVIELANEKPSVNVVVKIRDAAAYALSNYFGGDSSKVLIDARNGDGKLLRRKLINNNKTAITKAQNEYFSADGMESVSTIGANEATRTNLKASEFLQEQGVNVDKSDPDGFIPDWLKKDDVYLFTGGGKYSPNNQDGQIFKVAYFSNTNVGADAPVIQMHSAGGHTSKEFSLSDFDLAVADGSIKKLDGTLDQYEPKKELFSLYVNSKGSEILRVSKTTDYKGRVDYNYQNDGISGGANSIDKLREIYIRAKEYSPSMRLKDGFDLANVPPNAVGMLSEQEQKSLQERENSARVKIEALSDEQVFLLGESALLNSKINRKLGRFSAVEKILENHPDDIEAAISKLMPLDGQADQTVVVDPQKAADLAYFQSVIDDKEDMLDPEFADKLEGAYIRHAGDAEVESLFNDALAAYEKNMLAEAAKLS